MRHYEDLPGGQGDNIFFHDEPTAARELFPVLPATARVGGCHAELLAASMTRVTLRPARTAPAHFAHGQCVELLLTLGDQTLYQGRGHVLGLAEEPAARAVTLDLSDGYIDLARARDVHDDLSARNEVGAGFANLAERVPAAYKAVCADMSHALRRYRRILESYARDGVDAERLSSFEAFIAERAEPEWQQLWYRANALTRPLLDGDAATLRAAKRYTEIVVTQDLLDGAIVRRAYEKPLGYPGDHRVMEMAYSVDTRGTTPWARMAHRLGLAPAACIRTRMKMAEADIRRTIARADHQGPARVANIGCGTAQEVQNIAADDTLDAPVVVTLIDQDRLALSHVNRQTLPHVLRHGGRLEVDLLHSSFIQLMKAGRLFHSMPPQDYIYSLGLLDYLNDKRCAALVRALYAQLAPGGTLAIGNMKDGPHSSMWPMEFLTDWTVIFRSHDDMRAMAAGLDGARVTIEDDPTGRVVMLRVTRPET